MIPGAGANIGAVVAGQTLGNNIVLGSGSAVTFSSSNADLSVSGVISGAGSVAKTAAGTVTLSGTNTYTGGTTLSGGKLSVSSDANLGAASGARHLQRRHAAGHRHDLHRHIADHQLERRRIRDRRRRQQFHRQPVVDGQRRTDQVRRRNADPHGQQQL